MSTLVIGQHYWGHGKNLTEAKRNFKAEGGQLSKGYMIFVFDDGQQFKGVNSFGMVSWHNDDGSDREPQATEVPAR